MDRQPLSSLFNDPELRRVFARAERDNGASFAVPVSPRPVLTPGAAERVPELA